VTRDPYDVPFALRALDSPAPDVSRAEVVGVERRIGTERVLGSERAERAPATRSTPVSDSLYSNLSQSLEQAKRGVPLNKMRPRRDESIEPGRLRRAIKRLPFVEQVGPRQFRVKGNDEPWYAVDLDVEPPCYCKDRENRGVQCLHELACRLRLFEPQAVKAMADLIEMDERNAKELRKSRRKKVANG
jgi:hypothetical protein